MPHLPSREEKWSIWGGLDVLDANVIIANFNAPKRGLHASNDIANKGGLMDRLIGRERLRAAYGEGWRSP
jgi:hypothetical protein